MKPLEHTADFDFVNFDGLFFVGIAIDREAGAVTVTNQVGGTACGHPKARGVLVPLPPHWTPDMDPLGDWYLQRYDVEKVQAFLAACELAHLFRPLSEADAPVFSDPNTNLMLAEAWVPVRVRSAEDLSKDPTDGKWLLSFAGERMILTYPNSD